MILPDTHVGCWSVIHHPRASAAHRGSIADAPRNGTPVGVSVISCWEPGMLIDKNRLSLGEPLETRAPASLEPPGFTLLPVTRSIAIAASRLPGGIHGDPADRTITTTARAHDARLLTVDAKPLGYPHARTDA